MWYCIFILYCIKTIDLYRGIIISNGFGYTYLIDYIRYLYLSIVVIHEIIILIYNKYNGF